MANLAAKYRPKTLEDVTEQSIVVDMVRNLCSKPNLEARNFLFTGPAGCGKAQPLYSKIRTPYGWTTMGEIRVRDEVLTGQGNVAKVLGVFPQGLRDIYELTLADGRKIRVADNHLNPVLIEVNSYGDKPTHCLPYVNMQTNHLKHAIDRWNISAYTIPAFDDDSLLADRLITSCELIGKDYCQCIYVDKPEHTYITDDNVVTHNTTLCRIIASILNKGQGSPIEIDAASHSGVDSVREIVSQAQSYPVGSEWKCFIIDEVHSVSNQGWQAFLKTLEESPAKSIFLMATTNPEKIPATIISRVQTFQLSKISLQGIENRLKYIVSKENEEGQNITYEDSAISFIAKMANGGMRDSITLLEKAVAYDKNITSKGLVQALGLPNYDDFFSLLQSYAKKDNAQIAQIVDQVYNSGINFVKWMSDFHSFVVNVMKYIFLKDINKTTIPSYYQDKIAKYGPAHSSICLQLATTLVKLNHELKTTQYLQELTLTYLCFNPKK